MEAIASRLEAISTSNKDEVKAIAIRFEAITSSNKKLLG